MEIPVEMWNKALTERGANALTGRELRKDRACGGAGRQGQDGGSIRLLKHPLVSGSTESGGG